MKKLSSQAKQIARLKAKHSKLALLDSLAKKSATEIAKEIRGAGSFLRSAEWKKLRAQVIEKFGAKCMCCGFTSKHSHKINVDHIKPRKFYPELALNFDNLQVLCARCNKEKGNKHMTDYRNQG
jgi:5-methylcytosine-specific restriction endonuclease McrA